MVSVPPGGHVQQCGPVKEFAAGVGLTLGRLPQRFIISSGTTMFPESNNYIDQVNLRKKVPRCKESMPKDRFPMPISMTEVIEITHMHASYGYVEEVIQQDSEPQKNGYHVWQGHPAHPAGLIPAKLSQKKRNEQNDYTHEYAGRPGFIRALTLMVHTPGAIKAPE